jgi:hypothetical protein
MIDTEAQTRRTPRIVGQPTVLYSERMFYMVEVFGCRRQLQSIDSGRPSRPSRREPL